MATLTFEVASYTLNLAQANTTGVSGNISFYAHIACKSAAFETFVIYFLRPDSDPASNGYNPAAKYATSFVPAEQYPWYVDMLRHEKPVYAKLNSDVPQWNTLSTSAEPVGEGGA